HRGEPATGSQFRDPPGLRQEEASGYEETARVGVSRRSDGTFEVATVPDLERQELPPALSGGGVGGLPVRQGEPIPEDCHQRCGRDELLEQLELLRCRLHRLKAESRDVPTRVPETLDEAPAHWVTIARHDDGDRRSRLLERGKRWRGGNDHVHLKTDEVG